MVSAGNAKAVCANHHTGRLPIAIITAFNEKSNENYENVNYVLYTKNLCKNC